MRIKCPFCGSRDIGEFTYLGDASVKRPDTDEAMFSDVYQRENPRGPMREYWYHAQGCRAWLEVERDTANHEVISVVPAGKERS